MQAAAEDLPLPSNHFDVVYSIYMFHEMPDEARDAALKVRNCNNLIRKIGAELNTHLCPCLAFCTTRGAWRGVRCHAQG